MSLMTLGTYLIGIGVLLGFLRIANTLTRIAEAVEALREAKEE